MVLWRLSNYADLSGAGGLRASGRWHTRGKPIVYLADHPASCLLEMLVHCDRDMLPATYRLLRVDLTDTSSIETCDQASLPPDWRNHPELTRKIGDAWLDLSEKALLKVPSAILPNAEHYVLNPAHPDAGQATIVEVIDAALDPRLRSAI